MKHGKKVCKILKEIRQQIAERNDIELFISECHFQGECKGTCPKCEAEVRYLEKELNQRRQLGKAVAVTGISLGMAGAIAGCGTPTQKNTQPTERIISEEVENNHNSFANTPRPSLIEDTISNNNQSSGFGFKLDDGTYCFITEGIIGDDDRFKENLNREIDENAIYQFVEVMPEYPGGEEKLRKFIADYLVYPKEVKENGIQGTVYLSFVVKKDGTLSEIQVIRGIGSGCDEEALRIIKKMPKWKPGTQDGKKLAVKYTIPVRFKFEDKK